MEFSFARDSYRRTVSKSRTSRLPPLDSFPGCEVVLGVTQRKRGKESGPITQTWSKEVWTMSRLCSTVPILHPFLHHVRFLFTALPSIPPFLWTATIVSGRAIHHSKSIGVGLYQPSLMWITLPLAKSNYPRLGHQPLYDQDKISPGQKHREHITQGKCTCPQLPSWKTDHPFDQPDITMLSLYFFPFACNKES